MRLIFATSPLAAIMLCGMAGPMAPAALAQPSLAEAATPSVSPSTPAPPKRRRYCAVAGGVPVEPERREADGGPIAPGDNVRGILDAEDARRGKGRFQDHYAIDLAGTETISIVMQADAFSPLVLIKGPKGSAKPVGYALPGGRWRVILKPGVAGTYRISATSHKAGAGAYTLSVE